MCYTFSCLLRGAKIKYVNSRGENKFSPLELTFILFSPPLASMKNLIRHSERIFGLLPCNVNNYFMLANRAESKICQIGELTFILLSALLASMKNSISNAGVMTKVF